jgi:hypothetical protein
MTGVLGLRYTYDVLLDAVDGWVVLRDSEASVELLARALVKVVE